MGSESLKSCTPHRDSLRRGSEGGSERVRRGVRKSLEDVQNLAPLIGIRFAGGPKVGPTERVRRGSDSLGTRLARDLGVGTKVCTQLSE